MSSKPLKDCIKNPKEQYQRLTSDCFPASMPTPDPTQFLPLPCTQISFSRSAHSLPRTHCIHKWRAVRMLGMVRLREKKKKNKDSKHPLPPLSVSSISDSWMSTELLLFSGDFIRLKADSRKMLQFPGGLSSRQCRAGRAGPVSKLTT